MQKPYEVLDDLAMQSRFEKQSLQEYITFLQALKEEVDNKIALVKSDINQAAPPKHKGKYFGSEQEDIDREQDDLTNSQMQ